MKYIFALFGILIIGLICWRSITINPQCNLSLVPVQAHRPSTEHLLEKRGLPDELLLEYREQQLAALRKAVEYRSGVGAFPGSWEVQGPGNIGAMVTSIAVDPKNEKVMYAGFSEGGLFKTIDGGNNWIPIFDDQTMLSIGCIAIDPKNTNIIYVGTGDPNNGGNITAGNGLYKSTDGGLHWIVTGLQLCRNIAKVVIDAQNPSIIVVAALGNPFDLNEHRGIYTSKDGGKSWSKTLFINNGVGFIDLVADPRDASTLYASSYDRWLNNTSYSYGGANAGIYKSTNHGDTWKKLNNALPVGKWGRVNLGISANNPSVIYASYISYDTLNKAGSYNLGGIRISTDKGATWNETAALEPSSGLDWDCLAGFGWYFGRVVVNPKNENDIFLLGVDLWRSFNRGTDWIKASPDWWTYEVHADKHELVFLSDGSFILGTDGGLYKTDEFITKWEDIDNIPCTQFYRVTYFPQYPDQYFGGTQDNGSIFGNKNEFNNWQKIFGGDGFQLQARRSDPNHMFAETQNGNIWDLTTYENLSDSLPGTKNWDMPYFLSVHNDEKLIAGTDHVYEKIGFTNAPWRPISNQLTIGGRFASRKTPTITTLDESKIDYNIIVAGTTNGMVWLRENTNQIHWKDISSNLPPGYITSVKTSHTNKNIFYVTLSTKQKNDYSPFVYKTTNSGQSWSPVQADLPMFPVYDIFVYPYRHDSILFVGTDIGVYATINAGTSWKRLGENMPFIPVFDLEVNVAKNQLVAGTFARSIQSFTLDKLLRDIPVSVIETSESNKIQAFPNPCRNQVSIVFTNKLSAREGFLFDVNGMVVKRFKTKGESVIFLDVQNLIPGLYLLQIAGCKPIRIFKE